MLYVATAIDLQSISNSQSQLFVKSAPVSSMIERIGLLGHDLLEIVTDEVMMS